VNARKQAERGSIAVVYRVFISANTLFALFIMAAYYLLPGPEEVRQVLYIVDSLNAFILLADALYTFYHAPNRLRHGVSLGWLELLGAIPGFPFLRLARIPGLMARTRQLQRETTQDVLREARRQLASSTLLSAIMVVMLMITVGSIAIVLVEKGAANANIQSGEDAVWWAIVTMATVGYGDRFPTTPPGRLIGTGVIFAGVGLFSVLTSFIATNFVARRESSERTTDDDGLRAALAPLVSAQQAAERESAALRAELAELRRALAGAQPGADGHHAEIEDRRGASDMGRAS
jgi:voltage-gated potassium channel